MTPLSVPANLRVLVVDDNPSIHEDFRRILSPGPGSLDLDADAAALFGSSADVSPGVASFEVECAHQGQQAGDSSSRRARPTGRTRSRLST